jgi:hypothetical protein
MPAINRRLRMVPESPRCTVDILSHILYYKTQHVGKTSGVLINSNNPPCGLQFSIFRQSSAVSYADNSRAVSGANLKLLFERNIRNF